MRKHVLIQAIAVLLSFSMVGCTFHSLPQDDSTLGNDSTAQSDIPRTEPPASTSVSTTAPMPTAPAENETAPPPAIAQPEPNDEDFVNITAYIPDILVDLRYATEDNFTNQQIYDFTEAYLRYGTAKKLMQVQEELKRSGYRLKIWDSFRPPAAQFKLWDVCPDPTYVSNPNDGFSSHSRGNTVDITLVYADGTELVMPTGFDDFSKLADRDYSDCSKEAADNARFLEQLMKKHGFKPYSGEWWHFTDTQSYPVDQMFEPVSPVQCYAQCNEFISLRMKPSTSAQVILKIPAGDQVKVVAKYGDFAFVEYQGLFGYVLQGYLSTKR